MYNNNGGSTNFSNTDDQEETSKITEKLRVCMYMLFALAFMRIFSLQFYGLISDLIAALIVYCTYIGKGRIIAMFCLINAFLGIVYSIAIGSMDLARLNKPQVVKGPYDNFNNNNNLNGLQGINNSGNYNNNNYQFSNNGLNNSNSNIPNKNVYGLKDQIGINNYGNNNYLNNNNDINNNDIINNKNKYDNNINNFLNIQDNNNNNNLNQNKNQSESRSSGFSFYYILAVTIYSVIAYCLLTYYSYKAFNIYKLPFGEAHENEENQSSGYYNGQNYGAVDSNRNAGYSSLGRTSAAAPTASSNRNFVAFGGSGQRLGD